MEPHELAIAALNQVARNTSYLERAEGSRTKDEGSDSIASPHSRTLLVSENDGFSTQCSKDLQPLESNLCSTNEKSRLSTPPTSNSDVNSHGTSNDDSQSQVFKLSHTATTQSPLNHAIATSLTAGQKRMADGHVKLESPSSSTAPPPNHSRSRRISTRSNPSTSTSCLRIEELTSELRTRLSYAMIKVNNGWQSNSIDEVESLASQKGSPSSSSSILHGRRLLHPSPRATIASIQEQIGVGSSSSSCSTQISSADFDNCCRLDQPSRTYESFWRDHSVTENWNLRQSPNRQPRKSSPTSRALAPPAEICSTHSRNSSTPTKYARAHMKPSYRSKSPSSITGPQTPQRIVARDANTINPSSQTTIQEQDAIETLIFMSSPGNLNGIGHALPPPKSQLSPQKSPLRSEVYTQSRATPVKRVGTELALNSIEKNNNRCNRIQSRPMTVSQDQERSTVIDCLLEEMGDSSSEEDDTVLKYSNSHQITAGRA